MAKSKLFSFHKSATVSDDKEIARDIDLSPKHRLFSFHNQPLGPLKISNPNIQEQSSTLKANVIVIVKYDFKAERHDELSVNKGMLLKLVDRIGNGWILVKFMERVHEPGLIPSSYVDIAINDPTHPLTLSWLRGQPPNIFDDNDFLDVQLNKSTTQFLTINNKPFPVHASISNFLSYKGKYWYRLDVAYSDHSKRFLCRYYQDFYNLHINLSAFANRTKPPEEHKDALHLPKLPEPIPISENQNAHEITEMLKRCNSLNIYINKLILNKYYRMCPQLMAWLEVEYGSLPGFKVDTENDVLDFTDTEINEKILPESINVVEEYRKSLKIPEEELASEAPAVTTPVRKASKNMYNNHEQASRIRISPHWGNPNPGDKFNRLKGSVENSASKHKFLLTLLPGLSTAEPQKIGLIVRSNSEFSLRGSPQKHSQKDGSKTLASPISISNPAFPNEGGLKRSTTISSSLGSSHTSPTRTIKRSLSNGSTRVRDLQTDLNRKLEGMASTPVSESSSFKINDDKVLYIKCKVSNQDNDIIAVKFIKKEIKSTEDLKRLVRRRMYFTDMFIKLPNTSEFINLEDDRFNFTEFLKENDKLILRTF